jgi:hypothetical protein
MSSNVVKTSRCQTREQKKENKVMERRSRRLANKAPVDFASYFMEEEDDIEYVDKDDARDEDYLTWREEFDFDESSREWNKNKTRLGNGSYEYK